MFCEKCGAQILEGALFCQRCGTRITSENEAAVSKQVVPTTETDGAAAKAGAGEAEAIVGADADTGAGAQAAAEPEEVVGADAEAGTGAQAAAEPEEVVGADAEAGTAEAGTGPEEAAGADAEAGTGAQAAEPEEVVGADAEAGANAETGAADARVQFCQNCGAQNNMEDAFCQNCGARLAMGGMDMQMMPPTNQKKKKMPLIIGGIAVVLVAIAGIKMLSTVIGGADAGDKLIYLKSNSIMTAEASRYKPEEIAEDLFEDRDYADLYDSYQNPVQYTEDGKYIFYMSNYNVDSYSYDVYYKKASGSNAKESKLDSDIIRYVVISKDKVAYLKSDSRFYIGGIDDKEKVASDVDWFVVSEDGKYVLLYDYDDNGETKLYVQDTNLKSDKIKIDDMSSIVDFSDDFKTIVYMKDDRLFVCRDFGDAEKIDSDVEYAYAANINTNLELYYVKSDQSELTAYDLFEDDLAASDAVMTEPMIEDYQTVSYQDSFWGMREVVETDDSYYDAYDAYNQKLMRDELRSMLQESNWLTQIELYYYSDKQKQSEQIGVFDGDIQCVEDGDEHVIICYSDIDTENLDKPLLSALVEEDDIYDDIEQAIYDAMQLYYINGKTPVLLEGIDLAQTDGIESIYLNQATDELYIAVSEDVDGYYDHCLYTCDYQGKDAVCELLIEDVDYITSAEQGIFYLSDINDEGDAGELYLNAEKIADDVMPGSLEVSEHYVLYLTDVNSQETEGTLCYYKNKESREIAEDVAADSYGEINESAVAYLVDYSFNRDRGDLEVFNGRKSIEVDTDVTCIFFGR